MMRIPFQDTRYHASRRWSDLLQRKQLCVDEIKDLLNRCDVLDVNDLIELRTTIEHRLNNVQCANRS